ncbi:MAG: NHLP leader peptide family RiPP precursor [Gemmatimonadota bacterium]
MDEGRKNMAKVIARAWTDDSYKKRLHSHPHETLAEAGLKLPEHHKIKVSEDSEDTTHIVIPRRPTNITDGQLSNHQMHADICKFFC